MSDGHLTVMVVEFRLPDDVEPEDWWAEAGALVEAVPRRFRTRAWLGIDEVAETVAAQHTDAVPASVEGA